SLIIFERAGHLTRGNAAENLATINPRKDLSNYLRQQDKELQSTILLRAIIANYDVAPDEPIQISIDQFASESGLNRSQVLASITRLQNFGMLEYQPSFKGSGIRLLDEKPPTDLKINKQELARRAANAQFKLRKIIDFAYHKGCPRNYILTYFQD